MTKLRTAAVALAGVLAITAVTATGASAQWRGHGGGHWSGGHWGGGHRGWGPGVGIGAGIAAGALIGSAVAAQPYGNYYYDDPGYGYAQPYGYDAGPTYYGSGYYGNGWDRGGNYGYGRCTEDDGYGRRTDCGASSR